MRSLLASSIDDRSGAMQWRPTPQTQREPNRGRSRGTVGEEDAKDAPRVQTPRRRVCQQHRILLLVSLVIPLHCQLFVVEVQFLTRIHPVSMVRAVLGAELS